MSIPTLKTVALFGATGGTGLAILKLALQAGSIVNVLARTPSKLAELTEKHPNQLQIVKGDIHDISSIKETLIINGRVADVVISGIGMVIYRQGFGFTSADPTICEDGTRKILSALTQIEREKQTTIPAGGPRLVLLSTTGISDKGRDIPIGMIPLYHWMLSVPHEDKKKMEGLVVESGRRWTLIRPSFLTDGAGRGLKSVRVSMETPNASREDNLKEDVAIGYTICREDVGLWIVEECVKKDGVEWEGKMVTLTH